VTVSAAQVLRCALVGLIMIGVTVTAGVALARDPTALERQELDTRVAAFMKTIDEKRYGDMLDEMPPRLFDAIARKANMPADQLRTLMRAQIDKVMQQGTIDSFVLDLPKAEFKTLAGGMLYAMIPTTTDMTMGGMKMTARSVTLALRDGPTWHLVRVAEAQVPILRDVYPDFATIEFPKDSIEVKR
jgi:hypothetical protein